MPAPLPKLVIPPAKAKTRRYSYAQLRSLWIQAGGDPALASTMAAVALASPGKGDPTQGLWVQGPQKNISDPLANAKLAVKQLGAQGIESFAPYASGAYQPLYRPVTPTEKAAQAAAVAAAKAASPAYTGAVTSEAIAIATAKATSDAYLAAQAQLAAAQAPGQVDVAALKKQLAIQYRFKDWATVNTDKNGNVTSIGDTPGINPPANALIVNGQPVTKSDLNGLWSAKYENTYQDYTGKQASPADIVRIVQSGVTPYGLGVQLSAQPGFTTSPVFKANAEKYRSVATTALGAKPPASLIRQAVAEGWDQATFQANLQALPQYVNGPEFKTNVAAMNNTYKQIYGSIPQGVEETIRAHTLQGWTPAEFGTYLRQQPQYQQSPEYRQNATQILNDLGITVPPPVPVKRPAARTVAVVGGDAVQTQAPVPPPPSLDINNLLHQAGVTAAERRQLHQIWATSVNPDGSLNVSRAASLAQPIKQRLLGTAYTQANPEIQQTLGAFGEGDQARLPKTDLQTLGEQATGHTTPAGIKLQAAFERAQQRMQGAFRGTLANPAVQNLFRPPPEDLQA